MNQPYEISLNLTPQSKLTSKLDKTNLIWQSFIKTNEQILTKSFESVRLRFSENSLDFSQFSTTEKFSGAIRTEIQWKFTESHFHRFKFRVLNLESAFPKDTFKKLDAIKSKGSSINHNAWSGEGEVWPNVYIALHGGEEGLDAVLRMTCFNWRFAWNVLQKFHAGDKGGDFWYWLSLETEMF